MRAPRRPGRPRAIGALLALCGASGCDIVEGLGAAGDTIFPERPTHVNAPGARLAAGNYSELDFAGVWLGRGTLGFKLLARTARPSDDSLSVIGFTDGRVCRVEHVGAYRSSTVAGPGEVMLSYLDGPGPRGTLRFVDSDCQPLPAVVTDATLSRATLADGRLMVMSGADLVLVDAVGGVVEPFERDVERVVTRANGPYLVQAGGELAVYDEDWVPIARYGTGVVSFGYLSPSGRIVFEDARGIWVAPRTGGPAVSMAPSACALGLSSLQPLYVMFRVPCAGGRAVAARIASVETLDLGAGVDPRHAEFWTENPVGEGRRWVTHFREFDETAGVGTLLLRSDDGLDVVLGERAAPEWVRPSPGGTTGLALVNVVGEVGDLVHFDTTGRVSAVAERALRNDDGVGTIVNFDGKVGDLGEVTSLGVLTPMLARVPRNNHSYSNRDATITAAISGFDGRTGTLSRLTTSFAELETVATRVLHPHHGFIEALFPGMAWIRADGDANTGTLEYQNTNLLFTAKVSEGVASFLPTTEGLIYSVPEGEGAGVWFADAK